MGQQDFDRTVDVDEHDLVEQSFLWVKAGAWANNTLVTQVLTKW